MKDVILDSTIKIPPTSLAKTDIQRLSQHEVFEYYQDLLLRFFKMNTKRGFRESEVGKLLEIARPTAQKHLIILHAKREIYSIEDGKSKKYYKNGRLNHPIHEVSFLIEEKEYTFELLFNDVFPTFLVRETATDPYGNKEMTGGIEIPANQWREFVEKLQKITEPLMEAKNEFIKAVYID